MKDAIVMDDFSLSKSITSYIEHAISWAHIEDSYVVMADPWLCKPDFLNKTMEHLNTLDVKIEIIYFYGSMETLFKNLEHRKMTDDRAITKRSIRFFAERYMVPDAATKIKYYQPL